ncbi:MAG: 2-oxo-4-hydroxy-4-carboxy-5-ureidoimidazoline decarboxylase [Betaproteobacteria bacterium]|nr:2-oxo-4-hydroxy-4-carboxy-5-ureidoimidazoline decarboxylase [Betaproteobacteria bacterium]
MTLGEVNTLAREQFVEALGGVFEHSPWVAEIVAAQRPFASVDALHAAMLAAVHGASDAEKLALICGHPELAGREAAASALTADSASEQGRLGFTALSRDELQRIAELNRRYRERFGFPCIVALRLHASRASVLAEMERRTASVRDAELAAALEQIGHITRGRLDKLVRP